MTRERERLLRELDALARNRGPAVEARACIVLAAAVRWVDRVGHGVLRLAAVNHLLGLKFRTDSVIDAGGEQV